MNMNKNKGKIEVLSLSDSQITELNILHSVNEFPAIYKTPTLNKKIIYAKREETGGICIMANDIINEGEIICYGNSSKIDKPIVYSYQIEKNIHLIGPGGLDHNCMRPNCGIDSSNNFIAKRKIEAGEFLTFNYLTTEYDMNTSFKCLCGEEGCFGEIKGFKYLNDSDKEFIHKKFGLSFYLNKKYLSPKS